MRTQRIAIYSGTIPSTTFIENLIHSLADAGQEVYLFGNLKNIPKYPANVHIYATPNSKWRIVIFVLWNQIKFWLQSRQHFKALRQHIFLIKTSSRQRWRLWAKYLPVVLHLPDVFHIQWAKATEEWFFLKEIFGVKLVLSLRGAHINYSPLADSNLANAYRQLFPQLHGFHAVSQAMAKEAAKYGAVPERIRVVYSGIQLDKLQAFEKKSYILSNPIRLLSVGRFHWKKGYHYALDAIKLLIDQGYKVQYTLIAGQVSEEILFQIHDLGLQSVVQVIAHLPQAEVFRYMQESDVLLLPSVEEGIANVVLEAMAIGLPVISSNCGGMEEVIENGVNGLLFQNRDISELSHSIKNIIEMQAEERILLAKSGSNTIKQQHQSANSTKKMLELYT